MTGGALLGAAPAAIGPSSDATRAHAAVSARSDLRSCIKND